MVVAQSNRRQADSVGTNTLQRLQLLNCFASSPIGACSGLLAVASGSKDPQQSPCLPGRKKYSNELASKVGRLNEQQPPSGVGWLKSKPTGWNTCKGVPPGRLFCSILAERAAWQKASRFRVKNEEAVFPTGDSDLSNVTAR